jgi:hypothetical protein
LCKIKFLISRHSLSILQQAVDEFSFEEIINTIGEKYRPFDVEPGGTQGSHFILRDLK